MFFKRNQIEEAISRTIGESSAKPSSELRTRVKRLLDADRNLGRSLRSPDPEKTNYAFYTHDAPGKGTEVLFSSYEAFAIMEALKLMTHEWSQPFAISILRRVRQELEKRHRYIISLDPKMLTDSKKIQETNRSSNEQAVFSVQEYLLIVRDDKIQGLSKDGPYPMLFENNRDAFAFQLAQAGRSCTWLELVVPACTLRDNLNRTLPRQRGRIG